MGDCFWCSHCGIDSSEIKSGSTSSIGAAAAVRRMVHQAIVIYSIPASLLFLTWLFLFDVVPAFDTLLPITAVGMLIWTKIEFDKVNKLKAQAAAMRKANKAAEDTASTNATAAGNKKPAAKKQAKKAD